ncbi:MAG: hypothetical protein ACTSYU_06400, partial [Promethearchaeota archaeon]
MDDLQIFVAHAKVYPRSFLKEKIDEIEKLHMDAHQYKKQLEGQGVVNFESIVKKIVKLLWKKGENNFAKFISRGELSHANLVKSLLKWPLE